MGKSKLLKEKINVASPHTNTFTPVTDVHHNPRICPVEVHQNANTTERSIA